MIAQNMKQSKYEPWLYFEGGAYLAVAVYVDDLTIACNQADWTRELKVNLHAKYKMHDFGSMSNILHEERR